MRLRQAGLVGRDFIRGDWFICNSLSQSKLVAGVRLRTFRFDRFQVFLQSCDFFSFGFQAALESLCQFFDGIFRKRGALLQEFLSQRAVGCFGGWEYVMLSKWLELPFGFYLDSMSFELMQCDIQRLLMWWFLEEQPLYECADPVLRSFGIPL